MSSCLGLLPPPPTMKWLHLGQRSPLLEKLKKWLHAKTGGQLCHCPTVRRCSITAYDGCKGRAIRPCCLSSQAGHQHLRQCSLSKLFPELTAGDRLMACTRGAQRIRVADSQEGCVAVQRGERPEAVTFCCAFLSGTSHGHTTCCRPTRPYDGVCSQGESARATLFAWVLVARSFHVNDLKSPRESLS